MKAKQRNAAAWLHATLCLYRLLFMHTDYQSKNVQI